jgi:hypothetical protein
VTAGSDDIAPRVGWGVFLVMIGVMDLIPTTPSGAWLVGTGILLLALCGWRLVERAPIGWLTPGLGGLALFEGIAELRDVDVPLLPIVLIAVGVRSLVAGAVATRSRLNRTE